MIDNQDKNQPAVSSKEVLEQIKERKIKQIPKWIFLAKNIGFWILWFLCIVVGGSAAISAVIFRIRYSGWEYYPVTHESLPDFIFDLIPYLWLILLVIFLIIGYKNFRQTKKGYRYAFTVITALSLLASVIGGSFLYTFGGGKFVDETIGGRIPFHQPPLAWDRDIWAGSERGLLAGTVTAFDSKNNLFTLEDFNQTIWTVDTSELSDENLANIEVGEHIRLVGLPTANNDDIFICCLVFPWDFEPGNNLHLPKMNHIRSMSPPPPCQNCQDNAPTSCLDIPLIK